ncbi:DUF3566 domain-containing protein [Corynebacterium breve]|uniref:DUF3566 domain-containing protein n=1 Tax=Corynebacterium breve TaxID=3049799 RepID=A0ABY8VJE4_9CORY|nr:DUF3566 domain-containing protein [Corynebacterium breve]WIM67700.1 DUF3566 domain-containing protein [Corynebacterium breve]
MATRDVTINKVTPFSAFKVGVVMGLISLVIWLIAVTILYVGMDAAGIIEQVNSLIGGVGGEQLVGFGLVFSAAGLMGIIGTVMMAVLAPLSVVIYNAIAELLGGLSISVADEVKQVEETA